MPTEKIKYTDNLKQGTDKLNSAIEAANTAETLSVNADQKATQALSNSEQTQTELTQAILAGDSSPLGGQLSVGAEGTVYAGPQERLLAEYNGLTADLADKASKTQLTNILDGTPKGAFETHSALQTAYPTGTQGIFLVRSDGHIYTWDGATWSDLGLYQAAVSEFSNLLVNSNVPTSQALTTGQRIQIRPTGLIAPFTGYSTSYQDPLVTAGDKLYSKFEITDESTGTLSTTTRMIYSDGTYTQAANLQSTPTHVSNILVADKSTNVNITVSVANAGTIVRKNQIFVNLTKLFGAGNEPTLQEFESLLEIFPDSWFDNVNQFDSIQTKILRKFVEVSNRPVSSNEFVDEETGKTYEYNLKQQDGFVVFNYEEVL